MAVVTVEFEEKEQANAFAILAEDGKLGEFLNEYIRSVGGGAFMEVDEDAEVDFDEGHNPEHEVTFRNK